MTAELAEEFLRVAEKLVESQDSAELLLAVLDRAEDAAPGDVAVVCQSAKLLFRYGVLYSKGRLVLLALDRIKQAEESDPLFFKNNGVWWQLWGNILVHLSKTLKDPALLESSLDKFARAAQSTHFHPTLYWDWGEAWILSGEKSGELSDFKQGILKFSLCQKLGIRSHFFALDFASALMSYGALTGDPSHLEEALTLLRNVVGDYAYTDKDESAAYIIAWRKLGLAMKMRYQLTHQREHFEEADVGFREAILASPKNGELWIDWGDLFLHAGWIKRDFTLIEAGLEKLTASKIKECDPVRVALLLGKGLIYFGIFLENLKLLKKGQEKIEAAQELAEQKEPFEHVAALAHLSLGLYFSDVSHFAHAAYAFEKAVHANGDSVESWHALYQTYSAWGLKLQDPILVKKAIGAISRLCELRPFSYVHLNEWGVTLLRLRHLEPNSELAQGYIEEALLKFQKASEIYENDETLYNWGCGLDLLGSLTGDEEHYIQATDILTVLFEKRPSELDVKYRLGLALSHLGELSQNRECLKQAIELLESVVRVDQDDENIWCELGYALLNLAELVADSHHPEEESKLRHEAEKALLHAVELGSGDACYHLACLYSLAGLYEASLTYLKKAEKSNYLPSKDDLEHDEWLSGVRTTDAFQDFLTAWEQDG